MYRVMVVEDDDIIAGTVKKSSGTMAVFGSYSIGFIKCNRRVYRVFAAYCSYGYKTSVL